MAVCCSCNEALIKSTFIAQVAPKNYYKLQTETRKHLFAQYTNKCKGVPICLLVAFKIVVIKWV